uniref:Zinc metalloproteinase n=1 Tax=Panagrolaimus sp. PS1159 TaxID=55785 RepID=A0AC35FPG1_9BILA
MKLLQLFCIFGFVLVSVIAFPKKLYDSPKKSLIKDKLKLYRDNLAHKFRFDSGVPKILKVEDEKRDEFFKIKNRPHELHKINKHLKDELYQGDIALTNDQIDNLIIGQQENGRDKRQAYKPATYPNNLWKKDGISFKIASSIDSTTTQKIRKAIKFWQDNTCLTFKENGPDNHFLNFYKGSGCWSYIGNVSSFTQQDISIGAGCEQVGIIEHEIGHALGFFHTQSRVDRDSFVKIDTSNIDSEMLDNFDKESPSTNDNFGLEYDYGSVMHYSENAFALDENKPVMTSLTSKLYQKTMGNRVEPSFTDVLMMNKLYQCQDKCASSTFKCNNQGFNNPSNCNKCVCPGGFGGENCGYRKLASNGSTTCGENLQATTEWKSLDRTVGNDRYEVIDEVSICHWFLIAPVGKHIEIKVDYLGRICSSGCFYGGTEFKLGNFTKTGYRMCCKADYENLPTMTSQNHLAIISLYTIYYNQQFQIKYRYID